MKTLWKKEVKKLAQNAMCGAGSQTQAFWLWFLTHQWPGSTATLSSLLQHLSAWSLCPHSLLSPVHLPCYGQLFYFQSQTINRPSIFLFRNFY